jgi:Ca2+-binding EF-hand superfamily protein
VDEMEKIIVAFYNIMEIENRKDPQLIVAAVFQSLDLDHNGTITEQEFVDGCMSDSFLANVLAPKVKELD